MSLEEEAGRGAAGTSGPGWDGEGGVPISEELWLRALRLKESLLANAETKAHVAPCGDGTIHVYISIEGDKKTRWYEKGFARVEIHPTGCFWFWRTTRPPKGKCDQCAKP